MLPLANPNVPGLLAANRQMHRWLTQGLPITVMEGARNGANDWLVVNQLAVLDLKNPAEEKAVIWAAHNQLQTCKSDIPDLEMVMRVAHPGSRQEPSTQRRHRLHHHSGIRHHTSRELHPLCAQADAGVNLAQAIARVNRVLQDKPGGLVVDTIGIAPQLKEALAIHTAANGKGRPTIDSHAAFDLLNTKLREVRALLEPLDWSGYREPKAALALLPQCLDHILALPEGKKRYGDLVLAITKPSALCGTLEEALVLSKEVGFLQGVRALSPPRSSWLTSPTCS